MGLWYALIVSALCCLHYSNVVRSHCIDLNSNIVSQGLHYVPGTNPCTVCICDKGSPKWCKSVLCSAPQNCKSFQVGSTCCEFKCLDDILTGGDGYKETYDVALRFIASAVTAVLSLSLLFFLFHRLRRRKVLLHQNQQIGDDQRSLSSIGYIAGSLGYLPESYLGSGNNELEFHYEDSSAHYSLWKPPGDYFPRGEAPPPYEEAVRSAQVDNDLINTQLRTASNTILNSITSIPRGVSAGAAGVATLTTGGSGRNSQVIQNIHDTVVCRHDMLNGSGGSTSVCTTSTEPTSSINNRPIEAPQYTNTNAHHHHIHTTNNSNSNNTNNHQQHQQQQYVNITVQNVVVHNNNTHSNTNNNTHSISNNTHSTNNSTHSSGNNVHSVGNSVHSTGNNSHSSSSNTHSTNNTVHSTSNNTHSITNSTHQNTNEMSHTALKQRKQDITATTTTTKPHHHKMTTSNSSSATPSVGHHGNSTAVTSSVTPSQSHQQAVCGVGHVEMAYENLPFIPERKHMGTLGKTRPSSSGQLKHRDSGGSTLATGGGGNSGDKTTARHGRMLASHYHQQQQTQQQQQPHSSSNSGGQQHHREQHTHHSHTSSSRNIKNSRSQECLRRGNRRNDETASPLNTPSSSITSGGLSSTSSSAAGISRILDGYKNIEVIRNKDTMIITEGISSHQAQSLKAAPLKLLSTVDRAHHRSGGGAAMLQPLHRTLPRDLSELLAKSVTAEDILLRSSGSAVMSTYSSRCDTGVTAAAAQQMVMSTPMTESSATTSKFMSYQCLSSSQEDEDYRSECENCKSAGFTRRSRNASGGAGSHGVGAAGEDDEDDDDDVLNETMTLQRRPLDERPTDEVQYYRTSLTLPTNTRKPRPTSTITTREAWFTTMQETSSSDSE